MQSRNEPATNTANDESLRRCSASRPKASRTEKGAPAAFGGVCGSARQKRAITAEAPAASCIGIASASALRYLPTTMPATIQPMVPSTRMMGKSFAGFLTWWKATEFVSDSVGM